MNGTAVAAYTLPRAQFANRRFALQLYNESFPRTISGAKRTDTFLDGIGQAGRGSGRRDAELHVFDSQDDGTQRADLAHRPLRTYLSADAYAVAGDEPLRKRIAIAAGNVRRGYAPYQRKFGQISLSGATGSRQR